MFIFFVRKYIFLDRYTSENEFELHEKAYLYSIGAKQKRNQFFLKTRHNTDNVASFSLTSVATKQINKIVATRLVISSSSTFLYMGTMLFPV